MTVRGFYVYCRVIARFLFVFIAEANIKIAPYICTFIKYATSDNQSA